MTSRKPSETSSKRKTVCSSKSNLNAAETISLILKKKNPNINFDHSSDPETEDSDFPLELPTKKVKENNRLGYKRPSRSFKSSLENLDTSSYKPTNTQGLKGSTAASSRLKAHKEFKVKEEELIRLPWLLPENIKDKNGKRPNEEGYDPSTLYVPPEKLKKLSNFERRYWEIKSDYFDKILAFKFGHFYILYHNDALVGHRLLDLKLDIIANGVSGLIHESHLKRHVGKFLDSGYQIAVAEQIESLKTKESDVAHREVYRVLTRGTYVDSVEPVDSSYSPRFCLCLYEYSSSFGVVFMDTTTHEFFLGEFEDNLHRGTLKTLLTRLKPLEIVYVNGTLSQTTFDICRNLSHKPLLSPVRPREGDDRLMSILVRIGEYFEKDEGNDKWPDFLDVIRLVLGRTFKEVEGLSDEEKAKRKEEKLPFYYTLKAMSICLSFLEEVMLADTVFKMGNFISYNAALEKKSSLYLDSQALESLEIFDIKYQISKSDASVGSLFNYMDKTVTHFGKRMLRRWIASPLLDPVKIDERLDAVEDLMRSDEALVIVHEKLRKLPDIERMVNKIYNISSRTRLSAVYYEDFARNRLKEFISLLDELSDIDKMVETFQECIAKLKSKRLRRLVSFKGSKNETVQDGTTTSLDEDTKASGDDAGLFPQTSCIVKRLKGMVTTVDGLTIPTKGISTEADTIIEKIGGIKGKLNNILEMEKKRFGNTAISYVHSRQRYELEISENLIKGSKRPENYLMTSKKIGYVRFHTPEIEQCVAEITELETELHKVLIEFIIDYFKMFYDYNSTWREMVACLGELDCLCGLAKLAIGMRVKCRPTVLSEVMESSEKNLFELEGMAHPSLAAQMDNVQEATHRQRVELNLDESTQDDNDKALQKFAFKPSTRNRRPANRSANKSTGGSNSILTTLASSVKSSLSKNIEKEEGFVRNDVIKEEDVDVFLITGPNMGGKSTLLRQTALAVVMAQVGSIDSREEIQV